jgi:hypothetical protein
MLQKGCSMIFKFMSGGCRSSVFLVGLGIVLFSMGSCAAVEAQLDTQQELAVKKMVLRILTKLCDGEPQVFGLADATDRILDKACSTERSVNEMLATIYSMEPTLSDILEDTSDMQPRIIDIQSWLAVIESKIDILAP